MSAIHRNTDFSLIRLLNASDKPLVLGHLLRLGQDCRRCRFGNEVSDKFLEEYVARFDPTNTEVAGYVHDGQLVGITEIRSLTTTWAHGAEVAFSVDAAHRGRGIGSALMVFALERARLRNLDRVFLICDQRNRPMQRVAEKSSAILEFMDGDCHAEIPVPLQLRIAA